MPVHIVLFRGINVGGNAIVRMADLRDLLAKLGFGDVSTYVQSGNVVLSSTMAPDAVGSRIEAACEATFGFAPKIVVRTYDEWCAVVAGNPMPEAAAEPSRLHAYLLAEQPSPGSVAALEGLGRGSERYAVGDRVLYLHTPDGIGRSKFAAGVERALKVPATARNWRTVLALAGMAEAARG